MPVKRNKTNVDKEMGVESVVVTKEKKAVVKQKLSIKREYPQSFRRVSDGLVGLVVPIIILFLWEISIG